MIDCVKRVGGQVPAIELAVLAVGQDRVGRRIDDRRVDAPLAHGIRMAAE